MRARKNTILTRNFQNPMQFLCKSRRLRKYVSDKAYVLWQYEQATKQKLDLKNPRTFNEKLQWLKLYWRPDILTRCADKYAVREFVAEKIGSHILKRLHGVYRQPEEIDPAGLPDRFVLQVNHGSGQHIVCRNKADLVWPRVMQQLRDYLRKNHYHYGREWCYKHIVPRILCEEYLDANPLFDYNFFCFNGVPRVVEVVSDRLGNPVAGMFDLDWNLLERRYTTVPTFDGPVARSAHFDRMVEYAAKLSEGFPFARVDFLDSGQRLSFGEITFYPRNGLNMFVPKSLDHFLGGFLELPTPLAAGCKARRASLSFGRRNEPTGRPAAKSFPPAPQNHL
jgi:hypothetical protein